MMEKLVDVRGEDLRCWAIPCKETQEWLVVCNQVKVLSVHVLVESFDSCHETQGFLVWLTIVSLSQGQSSRDGGFLAVRETG